jgi:hypothetical protein
MPSSHLLHSFTPSAGHPLAAANGSEIPVLGSGSYSPNINLTLPNALLTPSKDCPIISVSSLTHHNNKIVVFSDPISCIIPNNSLNNHALHNLINVASSSVDSVTPAYLDARDGLFKISASHIPDISASSISTTNPDPVFISSPFFRSTARLKIPPFPSLPPALFSDPRLLCPSPRPAAASPRRPLPRLIP